MILKYGIDIDDNIILKKFQIFVNQIYKLLPIREQGGDWQKPLETLIEELAGMQKLLNCGDSINYFTLLNKMEGLQLLTEDSDFLCYRRIIFECLNLINVVKSEVLCHQTL